VRHLADDIVPVLPDTTRSKPQARKGVVFSMVDHQFIEVNIDTITVGPCVDNGSDSDVAESTSTSKHRNTMARETPPRRRLGSTGSTNRGEDVGGFSARARLSRGSAWDNFQQIVPAAVDGARSLSPDATSSG